MPTQACLKIFLLTSLVLFSIHSPAANKGKEKGDAVSDTVITQKIQTKMAANAAVSTDKVEVLTNNGVVELAGTVNSDTDASQLIEWSQATEGVKDVDIAKLEVKNNSQPFADTVITAKVKGLLIREKMFGKNAPALKISIETNNGVVYLSGVVDNDQQANNAITLAKSVDGVKQVESRIKVGHHS